MERNVDIEALLFPVWEQPVFVKKRAKPIPGFKAITGNPTGDGETVFSVVSNSYRLVSNKEALDMGKAIHLKLFPDAATDSFEIFDIDTPSTKSLCHIDIIDKHYQLNLLQKEVYVPFVRIHNSYNRSRSLKFDIGFCRSLCNNGVIFEEDSVTVNIAHTKKSLSLDTVDKINVSHLKQLEKDFIVKTKNSTEISIPKEFFIPLAAKTLNKSFDVHEKTPRQKIAIEHKMEEFRSAISGYTDQYVTKEEMGETAYAFYNVITHYASGHSDQWDNSKNGMQRRCGMWINQVGSLVRTAGFNWEKEIKGYEHLLPQ